MCLVMRSKFDKIRSFAPILLLIMALASCQPSPKETEPTVRAKAVDTPVVADPLKAIPEFRKEVSTKPVASYRQKTDNPLNDWYFKVELFETEKTFHYLMKLEYEEIRGKDTLKIPNFGMAPQPVIREGPDKFSCIIGFMDKENKFREYKKVYVKNNVLKVTALKHYRVRE